MTTKAIREALKYAPDGMQKAALAEVDAIERAAKRWWDDNSRRHSMSMTPEDAATLESIARDAP